MCNYVGRGRVVFCGAKDSGGTGREIKRSSVAKQRDSGARNRAHGSSVSQFVLCGTKDGSVTERELLQSSV